jgi:hypothetical protein
MNNILYEYFTKLRIISKLVAGQRLSTNGALTICNDTLIDWFWRKLYHDSKDETTRVLLTIYQGIQQCAEQLIGEYNAAKDASYKMRKLQVIKDFAEVLKDSIKGLDNLSKTYSTYPTTVSNLEGIVHDYALNTYKELLTTIPTTQYTPKLRESIIYGVDTIYKPPSLPIEIPESTHSNSPVISGVSSSPPVQEELLP